MSIRAINWARDVSERIDIPPTDRMVLWAICLHHHDKTGECFPSYETIAKAAGLKRRATINAADRLEENGLIIKQKRRSGGHQSSNHYVLFGRPAFKSWRKTRVHDKAPCESAPVCTLPRVHGDAPDREVSLREAPAKVLRVIGGRDA